MLEALDLCKAYTPDQLALDTLNLKVEPGEVYCLLGGNGAGKSTTIGLFLGFLEPTKGEARLGGFLVHENPIECKRRLAYIPEQVHLYPELTGLENLTYFTRLAGLAADDEGELRACLDKVGLPKAAVDRPLGTYSKGMRQKVGIAMALAKKAEVLLLDEPTSGLDPKASNDFAALVAELAQEGAAILMATHDLFRTVESGTRVGILQRGKLVRELETKSVDHAELEAIYLEHVREHS